MTEIHHPSENPFRSRKREIIDSLDSVIEAMDAQWLNSQEHILEASAEQIFLDTQSFDVTQLAEAKPFLDFLNEPMQRSIRDYLLLRHDQDSNPTIYFPRIVLTDDTLSSIALPDDKYIGRMPIVGSIYIFTGKLREEIYNATSQNELNKIEDNISVTLFSYLWRVNCQEEWIDPQTFKFGETTVVFPKPVPSEIVDRQLAEKYSTQGLSVQAMIITEDTHGEIEPTDDIPIHEEYRNLGLLAMVLHVIDTEQWNFERVFQPDADPSVKKYNDLVEEAAIGLDVDTRAITKYKWLLPATIPLSRKDYFAIKEMFGEVPEYETFKNCLLVGIDPRKFVYGIRFVPDTTTHTHNPDNFDVLYHSKQILSLLNIIEPPVYFDIEQGVLTGKYSLDSLINSRPSSIKPEMRIHIRDYADALMQPTNTFIIKKLADLERKISLKAIVKVINLNNGN